MNQRQDYYLRGLFLTRAKLKASSRTSGLMSGFAMVAMVELNLEQNLPHVLLITFSLLTTCLISVHVFALMISVCILPNIETAENIRSIELSRAAPIQLEPSSSTQMKPRLGELPHEKLHRYIEMAWIFSTGLGTLLFLLEIPVILWVKLYFVNVPAAIAASAIMVPTCVIFILFAVHFYRKLSEHQVGQRTIGMQELQYIAKQLGTDGEADEENLNHQSLLNSVKTV
eukprot:gene14172-15651_t